ncbi:MAG: hypothetical protein IJB28_00870 [Bacteroidaceae bacterium]|nr:hypothetical protein [Bacteroidaceae bacterium]MBQ6799869.1 hypothetical protein [Bacteroidaceae bacterium]
MIRKLLLCVCLSACLHGVCQEAKTSLLVCDKEGNKILFPLGANPRIRFLSLDYDYMEVDNIRFVLDDMKYLTYWSQSDGVTDLRTDKSPFKLSGGELVFPSLRPNSRVALYRADGTMVLSRTVAQGGDFAYPLGELAAGVYVVNVNGVTCKFVKR